MDVNSSADVKIINIFPESSSSCLFMLLFPLQYRSLLHNEIPLVCLCFLSCSFATQPQKLVPMPMTSCSFPFLLTLLLFYNTWVWRMFHSSTCSLHLCWSINWLYISRLQWALRLFYCFIYVFLFYSFFVLCENHATLIYYFCLVKVQTRADSAPLAHDVFGCSLCFIFPYEF